MLHVEAKQMDIDELEAIGGLFFGFEPVDIVMSENKLRRNSSLLGKF